MAVGKVVNITVGKVMLTLCTVRHNETLSPRYHAAFKSLYGVSDRPGHPEVELQDNNEKVYYGRPV